MCVPHFHLRVIERKKNWELNGAVSSVTLPSSSLTRTFFLFLLLAFWGRKWKKKCSWKPRWKETVLRKKAISDMWIILHYFIALILWLITVSIQNGSFLQCYNLKKIVSFKLLKIGHDYIRYSSVGKEYAWRAGDLSSIPGSGRSSGEGNGNPFQYPCLENPRARGDWWAAVNGVTKSRAWLNY